LRYDEKCIPEWGVRDTRGIEGNEEVIVMENIDKDRKKMRWKNK